MWKEKPNKQMGFKKGEGAQEQNEQQENSRKKLTIALLISVMDFGHAEIWTILKMDLPEHLISLLRRYCGNCGKICGSEQKGVREDVCYPVSLINAANIFLSTTMLKS